MCMLAVAEKLRVPISAGGNPPSWLRNQEMRAIHMTTEISMTVNRQLKRNF